MSGKLAPTAAGGCDACAAKPAGRLAGIEALRVAAAFGIVWFHVGAPGALWGYSGLPAFVIVATAFAAMSGGEMPTRQYLIARCQKLGMPWLFWSLAYGGTKSLQVVLGHRAMLVEFRPWMLLTGPALHLWYLPFGIVVSVLAHAAARQGSLRMRGRAWWILTVLSAVTVVLCAAISVPAANAIPWAQWLFVMPAVVVGMALAATTIGAGVLPQRLLIVWALVVIGAVSAHIAIERSFGVPYIVGVTGVVVAWTIRSPASGILRRFAAMSFGVYLIHPLVTAVMIRCVSNLDRKVFALLVWVVSCLLIGMIRRTRLRVFV